VTTVAAKVCSEKPGYRRRPVLGEGWGDKSFLHSAGKMTVNRGKTPEFKRRTIKHQGFNPITRCAYYVCSKNSRGNTLLRQIFPQYPFLSKILLVVSSNTCLFSRQMCNLALAPLKRGQRMFFPQWNIYICLRFAGCQKSFIQVLHGGNDSHVLARRGFHWTTRSRQTG